MTVQHDIFLSDFKYFTLSKDADNKLSGIYEYESRTHEVFDAEVQEDEGQSEFSQLEIAEFGFIAAGIQAELLSNEECEEFEVIKSIKINSWENNTFKLKNAIMFALRTDGEITHALNIKFLEHIFVLLHEKDSKFYIDKLKAEIDFLLDEYFFEDNSNLTLSGQKIKNWLHTFFSLNA